MAPSLWKKNSSSDTALVQELQEIVLTLKNQLQREIQQRTNAEMSLNEEKCHSLHCEETLIQTNDALTTSRAEVTALQTQVTGLYEENQRLQACISEQETQALQQQQEMVSQKEMYTMVTESVKASYGQLIVSNKNLQTKMDKMIHQQSTINAQMNEDLAMIREQLHQKMRELTEERRRSTALETLLTEEQKKNQMLEDTVSKHEKSLEEQMKERLNYIQESQLLFAQLQNQKKALRNDLETLQDEKHALMAEKDQASETVSRLEKELMEEREISKKLTAQLHQKDQCDLIKKENENIKEAFEQATAEAEKWKEEVDVLRKREKAFDRELDKSVEMIYELQEDNKAHKAGKLALLQQLKESEHTVAQLKAEAQKNTPPTQPKKDENSMDLKSKNDQVRERENNMNRLRNTIGRKFEGVKPQENFLPDKKKDGQVHEVEGRTNRQRNTGWRKTENRKEGENWRDYGRKTNKDRELDDFDLRQKISAQRKTDDTQRKDQYNNRARRPQRPQRWN